MDIFEAIRQRRSIRSYKTEEITEAEIKALLETASRASSACNRQTWRFVIVREAEIIEILYRAVPYISRHQRPAAIIPVKRTKSKTKLTLCKPLDEVVYRGHFLDRILHCSNEAVSWYLHAPAF